MTVFPVYSLVNVIVLPDIDAICTVSLSGPSNIWSPTTKSVESVIESLLNTKDFEFWLIV